MKYYAALINEKGNIAVDDTILVKDVVTTAGSHILDGYKPLFSAEAVTRLENKGYTMSGKTHVGEFGLDLLGEFSFYSKKDDIKAASAELVAQDKVEASLSVDVNGTPRRCAAISKVDFLKPTYGTVSRYGIISTAASGEQLGVCAKSADKIAEIISVIAGHDDKDGTSLSDATYNYATNQAVNGKKICIVKELLEKADDQTKATISAYADLLKQAGAKLEEISFDFFDLANTAWQILMCAETCNNLSRYDGVKFGHRAEKYKNIDELYVNSRTEGFNFLTKAIILYGSDVLSKNRYKDCYDKALRVRRVVSDKFKSLMQSYDAVLTPALSKTQYSAYDIKDAFVKVFEESVFTSLANLIGTPALVTSGVQLLGKHFDESLLLSIASAIEKEGK